MESGILAGYAMRDVKVTLSTAPTTRSTRPRWRSRSRRRWPSRTDAARGGRLLEPVMKVEVVLPEIHGRRHRRFELPAGEISAMETASGLSVIQSMVPLAELFGYATDLRSRTQGRGNYTMHFAQVRGRAQGDQRGLGRPGHRNDEA
jgi:elongation factor G